VARLLDRDHFTSSSSNPSSASEHARSVVEQVGRLLDPVRRRRLEARRPLGVGLGDGVVALGDDAFGSSEIERLRLDHEYGHARVRARLVFLTRLPENGLAGLDRLTLPDGSADPARSADDRKELGTNGRMPSDDTSRADFDHDHVGVTGEAPDPGAHAAGRGHRALSVELDPPQTRSPRHRLRCRLRSHGLRPGILKCLVDSFLEITIARARTRSPGRTRCTSSPRRTSHRAARAR